MIERILDIASLGLKPLYEKHYRFYKIISDFRDKLPRPQNTARKLSEEEKAASPFFSELIHFNVVDLSTQKTSVSEADIDQFYNRLNHFDFRFMLFQDYYKGFIRNLNRFSPQATNKNFDLFMIQQVLKDDPLHPIKPFDVLFFNLKWKVKWSSTIHLWFFKMTKKRRHN